MAKKQIKAGTLYRTATFQRAAVNQDTRTIPLSFSSEAPVARWFGTEILDHSPDCVRLDRMMSGGPLLMDHDPTDQVGVVEDIEIGSDRVGRATVRFGRSERAESIYQDVLDGIRQNVSVGYQIHKMALEDPENECYRAVDWEPLEISLVSVPADTSVGVGRAGETGNEIEVTIPEKRSKDTMKKCTYCDREHEGERCGCEAETRALSVRVADAKTDTDKAVRAERERAASIRKIAARHNQAELGEMFISEGRSAEEFGIAVLDKIGAEPVKTTPDIGMSRKEVKLYSIMRAINALANPGDRKAQEAAAFELEASRAVADKMRKSPQGMFIPNDIMTRDLTVGAPTAGGNLVATNLLGGSFIDLLRARMLVLSMGAKTLTGLSGNVAIPRMSGGALSYWVSEGNAPTEGNQTFDQVAMTPKTVGAMTDISRKLLIQSSVDVQNLVMSDLATSVALAIQQAAINGDTNAGEPGGILGTSGIGAVAIGADGGAPTWASVVGLWSEVATDNADFGTLGFLTNPQVIGKLMQTLKSANNFEFICRNFPDANGITDIAGSRCGVTSQVPHTLTKGNSGAVCSAMIYGNWSDLIIGMWGAIDILVDPYTGGGAGTVRVRVLQDVDVAVRHAESFAACQDMTTT